MGRHCGCRGTSPLALGLVSIKQCAIDGHEVLHRLKLVTGVDISTRPVRRAGREGKAKKSTSLKTAAEVNRIPLRRSMTMFNGLKCTTPRRVRRSVWHSSAKTLSRVSVALLK